MLSTDIDTHGESHADYQQDHTLRDLVVYTLLMALIVLGNAWYMRWPQ